MQIAPSEEGSPSIAWVLGAGWEFRYCLDGLEIFRVMMIAGRFPRFSTVTRFSVGPPRGVGSTEGMHARRQHERR